MWPYENVNANATAKEPLVWVRYLLEHDLDAVMRIERASSSYPRTQAEFVEWLRPSTRVGLVAGLRNQTVGYIIYEQNFHRLDLLDFVVEPACRGRGIGHQMMARMVERLDLSRRTHLGIVVNERNVGGQLFLRHEGFRFVELLRGRYAGAEGDQRDSYPGACEDGYRFLRGREEAGPVAIGPPSGKGGIP